MAGTLTPGQQVPGWYDDFYGVAHSPREIRKKPNSEHLAQSIGANDGLDVATGGSDRTSRSSGRKLGVQTSGGGAGGTTTSRGSGDRIIP